MSVILIDFRFFPRYSESMSMVVEEVVRVTIAGMARAVYLPPDLVWKPADDNRIYVKMLKPRSEINRLLGQPIAAKGPNKVKLVFTSILETLLQLRDEKVMSII